MQEHGSFEMEIIDQTLIVRCFDDWNQELVVRLCKEYKELVKKLALDCEHPLTKYYENLFNDCVSGKIEVWAYKNVRG